MAIVTPTSPSRQEAETISVDRCSKIAAAAERMLAIKRRLDAEEGGHPADAAAFDQVHGYLRAAEPLLEAQKGNQAERIAPAEPVKATRRERRAVKGKAEREHLEGLARARELQRWREKWEAGGGDPKKRPPLITREQWGTGRAIIHSPKAAQAALQWLARHYGGAVVARVYDAAFGGGRWDLSDVCARKFVALIVFLYQSARLTSWGRTSSGRMKLGLCVRGVSRGALCALLADPHTDRPISLSTLSGWSDRWAGYLARGHEVSAFEAIQIPAHSAAPWEIGPSGYATNRYWLHSPTAHKPSLELSHLDTAVEHERGWSAAFGDGPVRLSRVRQLPANDAAHPE